jgi:D-alanyl-lipoteichoic acid acyltransferase DltB (MBOAT superfamily)
MHKAAESLHIMSLGCERRRVMAVASLVLGIIAIVIGVFSAGALGWLGGIIGIVGIILGVLAKKEPEKQSMATAGFVCSIIGTILCLFMYVACIACVGGLASLA